MYKTTLQIDGMMCSMCESHVNDAVRNTLFVKKVTSSHKKGSCEILSETVPDEERLRAALEGMGYRITAWNVAEEAEKKRGLFGRR